MVPTPVGSGPVPLVSVHHTVISTVVGGGLAIGAMASQSQSIPGHQVLANIHGPLSQAAVVIPYTLAAQQANPHLPGQMTASPYLPATFNYVSLLHCFVICRFLYLHVSTLITSIPYWLHV